jgi:calcineurin-like phosphoesterase family protein
VVTLPWASMPRHYQSLNGEFDPIAYGKRPKVVLSHYSMRAWHAMEKGCIMLYGHSHNGLSGFRVSGSKGEPARGGGSLDIGVDCWDFRPVDLDQIKARLAILPEKSAHQLVE